MRSPTAMIKSNPRVGLKLANLIIPLLMFVANCPSNFIRLCMALPDESLQLRNYGLTYLSISSAVGRSNDTTLEEDIKNIWVTGSFLSFAVVSCLSSVVLLTLILLYLNSVDLAKECVLLSLYKDLVIIWILIDCVCMTGLTMCYIAGSGIDGFTAVIIPYFLHILCAMVLAVMNVIAALRFYTMKANMLDPPMPWGDNERLGIMMIRLFIGVLSIGIVSIIYALGCYPKMCYLLKLGYYTSTMEFPQNSLIVPGYLFSLQIVCLLTYLRAKYYESANNQLREGITFRQMQYFFWIVMVLFLSWHICETFQISGLRNQWRLLQVLASISLAVAPLLVILTTNQLKSYILKILENVLHEMFLLSIYLTPAFLLVFINGSLYLVYGIINV